MKFRVAICLFAAAVGAVSAAGEALAYGGRLSPKNFNKMYYLASHGKIGILREAVNRGLNIDAVNPNGDTGLCIAIKRKDHIAYNSFRMSGANPRHACTYKIVQEYREFLDDGKAAEVNKVVGNEESLYWREEEKRYWPWILGGAAVGGAIWALSSGGGGGSSRAESVDDTLKPVNMGYGLTALIGNNREVVAGEGRENSVARLIVNPDAAINKDKIRFLPDVLENASYLMQYIKVTDGGWYNNLKGGEIDISEATVALGAYGDGSKVLNNGNIVIESENGSIGMAASNGASAFNSPDEGADDPSTGKIEMSFKGGKEGTSVIGMYGDTGAKIVNYGRITGTTSALPVVAEPAAEEITIPGFGTDEDGEQTGEEEGDKSDDEKGVINTGTILGMALFDLYSGTNWSANVVTADNYGQILLSGGYNGAMDMAVSLIGMGSYIDNDFLNGKNNPAFAEQMKLNNFGKINLDYQGNFALASGALKTGQGGLIGIRADASTTALNQGDIAIDLTATTMAEGVDVAAGMLSVHGAELVNGNSNSIYDGSVDDALGTIRIVNEATSGGVSYGMLAAKGEGMQSSVYNWQLPKLANYGFIDMQTSNSYAMASFAGGEVVNKGVINLGVEKGESYYTNNYGLYAAGAADTAEVSLVNEGIINVYSQQSTALYNAFAGAVDLVNEGSVYISNKATGSEVFGGNYSYATNNGSVVYKVSNADKYKRPDGENINALSVAPLGAAVSVAADGNTTKQTFTNNGEMIVGDVYDKNSDYGGTFASAAVRVTKQGAANNEGSIVLKRFDKDRSQFNVAMWLDSAATPEAILNNYGEINIEATDSVGMLNRSSSGAAMYNYGNIYVNGYNGMGMVADAPGAILFNGSSQSPAGSTNSIYVNQEGGTGIYVGDGATAYNYGAIYVRANDAKVFVISGGGQLARVGDYYVEPEYSDVTIYEVINGGVYTIDYPHGTAIEEYTLGKAVGGTVSLSEASTVYARGLKARVLAAEGIQGKGESRAENYGVMELMLGATGIDVVGVGGTASGTNASGGVINVSSGTGIRLTGQEASAVNLGKINVTSGGSYGVLVVNDRGTFTNQLMELPNGLVQVGQISVEAESGTAYGVYGNAVNNGYIDVGNNGIGIYGTARNNEKAVVRVFGNGIGIWNELSNGSNIGSIDVVSADGIGVKTVDGVFQNAGVVSVRNDGKGVFVGNRGSFVNTGTINIDDGYGIYVDGVRANAVNSGEIHITGKGYGAYVVDGWFINNGEMTYNSSTGGKCYNDAYPGSGTCTDSASTGGASIGDVVFVGEGGTFVNSGTLDLGDAAVDFDALGASDGSFVLAKGGTYKAETLKGKVVADKNMVLGGFRDTYVNKNSFVGADEGLDVVSGSYLFDAEIKENEDGLDVELKRKDFSQTVKEEDLAAFFETNYKAKNNEKMFNALKSAETADEFEKVKTKESGKNFYANLPRENMAVLRGLHTQEQNRILEDGLDGAYIGADYYRTGKDATDDLSGYADNVYSPYIGYGKRFNRNWSVGGMLRAAYVDAEYDEAHSSRNNKILLASLPILYQNDNFKFLTMPSVGVGFGEYERKALSGSYEADTFDLYYGMYNHAEYSVDMKVAELVMEAELNLQGSSMSKAKEDNEGLNLHSNNSLSLESGVGVKLRKRIELAKQRSLMLAVGVKYYHEFLDPYKDLTVGMSGSPVNYKVNAYDENKDRIRTSAEAVYKDGDFSVAAEIAHNIETENNVEGGVGVRYSF